jgi:deazaflavin-dependent oxidoreductase (nitroreductase family)
MTATIRRTVARWRIVGEAWLLLSSADEQDGTMSGPLSAGSVPRHQVTVTTTGRRSGEPRTVTLYAFEDGDRLIVVGSNGGKARDPDWARNLRSDPRAFVVHRKERRAVIAHEPDGAERERLWVLVTAGFPMYATYQRKTSRRIPVFALEPNES